MMSKRYNDTVLSELTVGPRFEKYGQKNPSSEEETVRLAQRGDASAFERIYHLHCSRVYGLCLRMVRNPAEAEDLTQEAFLLVFRKLRTFRGESGFSTWLHRLAVNVVLMHLRKRQLPLNNLDNSESGGMEAKATANDDRLSGVADRVSLKRAVVRLTPVHRAVFVLHDIQGFNHVEIAGMMEYSVNTSKTHLHRARKQLRKFLQCHRSYSDSGQNPRPH